jgi:hypothetical protein
MKATILTTLLLAMIIAMPANAQEKSKKEQKQQKKLELQKEVEAMVNAKSFVFAANRALPQGYPSVDMTSNPNHMKFYPDSIDSYMPFFGRAYSVGYGGSDNGLKFSGKPQDYTVTKTKKEYLVKANVKTESDFFRLTLSVGFEGNASLSIISNNRASISYYGDIEKHKDEDVTK